MLNSTSLWARRIRHVASPKLLWTSVLLTAVTVAVLWPPHAKQETCIRWWGMQLQLIGIYSVVRELRSKRQDVGAPTFAAAVKQWFARWPERGVTISAGAAEMMIVGGTVRATQRAGPPGPDASIEHRLGAVERNIKFIDDDLGKIESALDAERRAREVAVRDEKDERVRSVESVKNSMTTATAKTLPFSIFGVIWLALGVVLSSTSPELERLVHFLAK